MDEMMQSAHSEFPRYNISHSDPLNQWLSDREAWKAYQPATSFLAEGVALVPLSRSPCTTAWTDGSAIYVNPEWSRALDDTTRHFVQAHMIWHCAAGHLRQAEAQDERRWHLACDHQVNTQLLILGFELPPTAVLFPAYVGKSVAQVYDSLADNPLLKDEASLDAPPWPTRQEHTDTHSCIPGLAPQHTLQHHWQQRVFQMVRTYVGRPGLPTAVASWLIGQWGR